jgi:hypothetical protein
MTNRSSDSDIQFRRFTKLAGAQFLLTGLWTSAIALSQGLGTTTLIAITITMAGAYLLLAPVFLKRQQSALSALAGRFTRSGALVIPVLLFLFLFLRSPGMDALRIIGPILASLWLAGIEALFIFDAPGRIALEKSGSKRPAIPIVLFGYGILLIPSRVSSPLDGLPWNTPLEFVTAALLLPFVFFLARGFLSKKRIAVLLALLFVVKAAVSLFLPQSGLGVRVYLSDADRASGRFERTYASLLYPSYSQVMQVPFRTFFDFPIESINRHGFDKDNFWMAVEVNGAVSLAKDERLIIVVQGAVERNIKLVNPSTGEYFPVETIKSADGLDEEYFASLPFAGNAEIKGWLIFPNYGNARFEPMILKPNGSVVPALPRIRLSVSDTDSPAHGFESIQNLIAVALFAAIVICLFDGILFSYQTGDIIPDDLYLLFTGPILYYIVNASHKPGIDTFILFAVIALALVKLPAYFLGRQGYSGAGYLFAVGIPVLLMFLALDIRNLAAMTPIPQYQDAMEYQMLARNIYVAGDIFLIKSPPWAYKVLFPYLAGGLHILFGQSLSAQFFLNAWSVLLSAAFMNKIGTYFGLTKPSAFAASILFLILTLLPLSFTYFYRFGLIEPPAILALLLTAYFAGENKFTLMFILGLITGMLRLNFAGAVFTSVTFLAPAFTGGLAQAWGSFFIWLRLSWKRALFYLIAIPLPSLMIAYIYSRFHPGYTLTHEMNDQSSLASILESLASVIVGSDREYFAFQVRAHPLDLLLIALPVFLGLLVSLISLVYRKGIFQKLDMRPGMLLLSMLPVYAVLKPIGYFPRYSWSFLPPALIVLALVLQFAFAPGNKRQ